MILAMINSKGSTAPLIEKFFRSLGIGKFGLLSDTRNLSHTVE